MIYLDYQATTPPAPEVVAAMRPWLEENFANPHSPSRWGREAAAAIEHARDQILTAIGHDEGRFAFTSGATEALNWAIRGTLERSERRKIVTIATEHAAILDTCDWLEGQGYSVVKLPVGRDGIVDMAEAKYAIDPSTALVAAMLVNNEIGVVQSITELSEFAHGAGAIMLCDAVQGFGRMDIPLGPDLVAISGHKIHGPKGVGGLWMRRGREPRPLLHGGGQEEGLRSGTLSPALCVGFGMAAELAHHSMARDHAHVEKLWDIALENLGEDWIINGDANRRYRGNLNARMDGLDAARLMADLRNLAFSLGSACASGSGRPSHVLRALGLSDREARSSIRLGFGRYTGEAELQSACRHIARTAREQRAWTQ